MLSKNNSKILFLSNVFPEDVPDEDDIIREAVGFELDPEPNIFAVDEDIYSEQIGDQYQTDRFPIVYDKIPKYFIDIESWPKTINLNCWNCTNRIAAEPWFVPLRWVKILVNQNEVKAVEPHGVFCNERCVKRYINHVNDPKIINKKEALSLLNVSYRLITGRDAYNISEAPDPMLQMQFCGPNGITSQEYRQRNEST
jgi:hypothetical protein